MVKTKESKSSRTTLVKEYLTYEGPAKVSEIFYCEMCGKIGKFMYIKYPHPAIQHLLEEIKPMKICRPCAKRENGNKNKEGWEKIHE